MKQFKKYAGRVLTVLAAVGFAGITFADRAVSIFLQDGRMVVSNPSSVAVNYSVACYKKDGTSSVTLGSESIGSNETKDYGAAGLPCTGMGGSASSGMQVGLQGAGLCDYNNYNYANRQTICQPGYRPCSLGEMAAATGGTGGGMGWLNINSGSSSWEYSTDSGSSWTAVNDGTSTYAPRYYGSMPMYKCRQGGVVNDRCYGEYIATGGPTYGSVCCPNVNLNQAAYCKLNINTSSGNGGYLISPSFKGNSPF